MTKDEFRKLIIKKLKQEPLRKKAFRIAVALICSPFVLAVGAVFALCSYPLDWFAWAIGLDKETRKKWGEAE